MALRAEGGAVYLEPRPEARELDEAPGDPSVFEAAVEVLTQIRRYKAESHMSLRVPIERVRISGPADQLARLEQALDEVLCAAAAGDAQLYPGAAPNLRAER